MYRTFFFCAVTCLAPAAAAQRTPESQVQSRFDLRNRGAAVVPESTLKAALQAADRTYDAVALFAQTGDSLLPLHLASSRDRLYPGEQRFVLADTLCAAGCHISLDGVAFEVSSGVPFTHCIGPYQTAVHIELTAASSSTDLLLRVLPPCDMPLPDLPQWPSPDPENPWWVGTFYGSDPVEGWALPRLGADQLFDRPVLIVEGFDPGLSTHIPMIGAGDMHWEVLWNCTQSTYPDTEYLPDLLDSLHVAGYDVVYLDFSDGTREVAAQSALVQEVIGLCTAWKQGNQPLVAVGASMGGLIVRHALSAMEASGTPACTRLFIALDSPFRGAYLPISLQQALFALAPNSAPAHAMLEALYSPAAQELLVAHAGPGLDAFEALQGTLATAGLPELPLTLAVSNGRPDGPSLLNTGPLLEASGEAWGWEWGHVALYALPGNADHPESTADSYITCDLTLPHPTPLESGELWYAYTATAPSFAPVWEALPGSTSGHLTSFAEALEEAGLDLQSVQSPGMFIPARSALDLDVWAAGGVSPFDGISIQPTSRPSASHCDVKDHLPTLLAWLLRGDHHLDTADSTSALLTYPAELPYSHWVPGTHFFAPGGVALYHDAEVVPCADSVAFHAGSRLQVGAPGAPATFHIHADQTVLLEAGSELDIAPGSSIELHPGGRLILQTDLTALHGDASIAVHGDATLHLAAPGRIYLADESATVQLHGGRIETSGDVAIAGAGRLFTAAFSTVSIGGGGALTVQGVHPQHTALEVESSAGLGVYGPGELRVRNAQVKLGFAATCVLHARSRWDSTRVEGGWGNANLSAYNRFRASQSSLRRLNFTHSHASGAALQADACHFEDCTLNAVASGVRVTASVFMHAPFAVAASAFPQRIEGCTFTENTASDAALLALSGCSEGATIASCEFSESETGLYVTAGHVRITCSEFYALGTGIAAATGAALSMEDDARNVFRTNRVHIAFDDAPVPALHFGQSTFGSWEIGAFVGTWSMACPDSAFVLHAPANAWWGNASDGAWASPLPGMGFSTSACTAEVFVSDPSPVQHTVCTSPGEDRPIVEAEFTKPRVRIDPPQADGRVYPNPASSWVQIHPPPTWGTSPWTWTAWDGTGRMTTSEQTVHAGPTWVDVSSWTPGMYILELRGRESGTQRSFESLIVLSDPQ